MTISPDPPVEFFIFDVDGTMADTEEAHVNAGQEPPLFDGEAAEAAGLCACSTADAKSARFGSLRDPQHVYAREPVRAPPRIELQPEDRRFLRVVDSMRTQEFLRFDDPVPARVALLEL